LYPEIGKVPFEEIEKQANTFYSLAIKELEVRLIFLSTMNLFLILCSILLIGQIDLLFG
jgi:hypothetical protein